MEWPWLLVPHLGSVNNACIKQWTLWKQVCCGLLPFRAGLCGRPILQLKKMANEYLIHLIHMRGSKSRLETLRKPTSLDALGGEITTPESSDAPGPRTPAPPKRPVAATSKRPVAAVAPAVPAAAVAPVIHLVGYESFDIDRLRDDPTTKIEVVTKITCGTNVNEKGEMKRYISNAETSTRGWALPVIKTAVTKSISMFEVREWAARGVHVTERGGMCRGAVFPGYVTGRFELNRIVIVLVERVPELKTRVGTAMTDLTRGFVLAREETDDAGVSYMYIDVICADNGFGNLGLDAIIAMAKNRECEGVKLAAMASVLGYYPKFGFSHRKSCDPSAEKFVIARDISKVDLNKREDEYHHEDLLDYMIMLTLKGYSGHDLCRANLDNLRGPDARAKFVEELCADDGFYMIRCKDDAVVTDDMQKRAL